MMADKTRQSRSLLSSNIDLFLMVHDTERLKEILYGRIKKREKQIHPSHNPRFNHDLQLQIDSIEWVLGMLSAIVLFRVK